MCGIAGLLFAKDAVSSDDLVRMVAVLRHRGPDDQGIHVEPSLGLCHTRLAIIDLTSTGHQPMADKTGRFVIVFNGEVYNHEKLREALMVKGCQFRGRSDTEVVLESYKEYGHECVHHLRGMFAFAVWDREKRELFLARDRLGKKPLYYVLTPTRLAFASELRALLTLPWVSRRVRLPALSSYLMLQYVAGAETILESVCRLQPGHWAMVRCDEEQIKLETRAYWRMPDTPVSVSGGSPTERVQELIMESVRLRMISDVPLGIFLSGGLDSSLLAAMAARLSGGRIKTFSVRFRDAEYDEHRFARLVASHIGTEHEEIEAEEATPEILLEVIRYLDEPIADPASLPTFQLARAASRHVKVILSGEGADEMFGGYPHYVRERLFVQYFSWVPIAWRQQLARGLRTIPAMREQATLRRLARVLESPDAFGATRWVTVFSPAEFGEWLAPSVRDTLRYQNPYELLEANFSQLLHGTNTDKSMRSDLASWLPDDLLMKMDKMTMANSIEGRAPYLDHHLVEYVSNLPTAFKIDGCHTKTVLKEIASHILPAEIVFRKKHGFEIPLRKWLIDCFRDLAEDSFCESAQRNLGIFIPARVQREWTLLREGSACAYPRRLWVILCLMQWSKMNRAMIG